MVIDFHTHTYPDKMAAATLAKLSGVSHLRPFTDGTAAGLAASMAQAGVDRSIVLPVATSPRQVPHINDAAAQLNRDWADAGLFSLGCIHPDYGDWQGELARVAGLGLKGIKLHPQYQDTDFDDPRYLRILDRCGELGLVVLTHAGLDIGMPGKDNCAPEMVARVLEQVGPVKLVLAHIGGWRQWDRVEALLPGTGVYLDTSFSLGEITPLDDGHYRPGDLPLLGREDFLRLVRRFGADRVLFGTDSPWDDQGAALARLQALPLEPAELEAILGGNAKRLLGIA